jgi:glycosyltransferase involved in cell wall biosynthesis
MTGITRQSEVYRGPSDQRPIRVAMVHYRDAADSGGSLRVGETIANYVDPGRVAVELVFAYGDAGPVTEQARVPCHFLSAKGPKDFRAWQRARAFFRSMKPDIIHFQDCVVWLRSALVGTPSLKMAHVHASYRSRADRTTQGAFRNHPFEASQLLRVFLNSTDAQVCINPGAQRALLEPGWIKPERSYVVYNSIAASRFGEGHDRLQARANLGLPADALLLGMVCRLVWEKGCADLLPIMKRLPQRWHAVICGDGPEKIGLQREIESRGLANRIHFIGSRDDVRAVYAALDAYAFLSHYEPFGLVLAEAMASRVPVFGIAGDGEFGEPDYPLVRDGIVDLVPFARHGNYKQAVPAEIFDELAAKISYFGAQPDKYRGMIERAHAWTTACFDAPVQAEAMTRVYENVCANADSSRARLADFYEAKRKAGETAIANINCQSPIAVTA